MVRRVLIIAVYVAVFWLLLPYGLYGAGRLLDRILPDAPTWARLLGLPLAVGGAWLCASASLVLRTQGKGLPISSLPPTRLVTRGPYRVWRHPIYTGFAALASGLGLMLGSLGTALVVVPVFALVWFQTWVRFLEEPVLLRRFGGAYRAHAARTTMLLPLRWQAVGRALVRAVFPRLFRIRIEGAHHVPARGPVVIVADHLSYLDFMFGQYLTDRPIVIPVTAEVFRAPLRRLFMTMMGGVPKRRFCADPAAAVALADELAADGVVGIAIEGERSWTGEMGWPAPGVARNIGRFGCPVVPAAFVGAYRLWPRWAGGADRSAEVTIRLGEPFLPAEEIEGFEPGSPEHAEDLARRMVERIQALRDPEEPAVPVSAYPSPRPELTLWRCPVCGQEECLTMVGRESLVCSRCEARWDTTGPDLKLVAPADRAGERDSVAGWAARAGSEPRLPEIDDIGDGGSAEPVLRADRTEFREDPFASITLGPLMSLGAGEGRLHTDRLDWHGAGVQRSVPLGSIRSVTTERNDTLQLGVGQGVIQLVFAQASPLRWQRYVEGLLEATSE